jgi:hypothetical protein
MKKQEKAKKLELSKETLRLATAAGSEYSCEQGAYSYACPSRLCDPTLTG